MVKKKLRGEIESGVGDAGNSWGISEIQRVTGYTSLQKGTLNVRLKAEHALRPYCNLRKEDRKDGINEDLYFEHCHLVIGDYRVPALIARTSTNHWKSAVLEIMAEEMLLARYGLQDGDTLEVEVWAENCGG
jgi:CTP-dependent riboflavin kinase